MKFVVAPEAAPNQAMAAPVRVPGGRFTRSRHRCRGAVWRAGAPFTDLTISLTATLVDGKLRVHWTETGTLYTAMLAAVADGDLTR